MAGEVPVSIYVLPTVEGKPPSAMLIEPPRLVEAGGDDEAPSLAFVVPSTTATWSRDTGAWMVGGVPVDQELGEAITEHARSLGVEW